MVETMTERALPPKWWWGYASTVLFLALAGVVGGMYGIYANGLQDKAALQANRDRDKQISGVVECITTWSKKTGKVLGEREAVTLTVIASQIEAWSAIDRYVDGRETDPAYLDAAIERFLVVLRRLERIATLSPPPKITPCLRKVLKSEGEGEEEGDQTEAMPFQLVAYARGANCWGRSVTIRGTNSRDVINGTDGDDVIAAGRGNDLIVAGHGRDYICARGGNDTINGGQGRDSVRGGMGDDACIQTEVERSC